jgi:hypothetical protein
MSEVPTTSQTKDSASRPRFTLRTLLLAFIPVCGLLAAYHWLGVDVFPALVIVVSFGLPVWGCRYAPKGQGWEILSILPLLGCFFFFCLMPMCTYPRQAARRSECMNNLKQIGLALYNYHDIHGSLPARTNAKEDGSGLSWRVAILPYIEQQALFKSFRQDEDWNSSANLPLAKQRPYVYRCPSDKTSGPTQTNYYAIGGDDTCWPDNRKITFSSVTDGTSNTLLVVESHDVGAVWSEPRDLEANKLAPTQSGQSRQWISSRHQRDEGPVYIDEALGFRQKGPVTCGNVALADGSVRYLAPNVDPKIVRQLVNRRDGQPGPDAEY